MDTRFHAVYLLTSLDPRCEGYFYVGYTVNPLRRLRQHNGELTNGALRTSRRGRPWTLVCCVSGFSEDRVALKFEWCWQHPHKAALLKSSVHALDGLHRLRHAVGVLLLLLRSELFAAMSLRLNVVDRGRFDECLKSVYSNPKRSPVAPLVATALLQIRDVTHEDLKAMVSNCEEPQTDETDTEENHQCVNDRWLAEQGLLPCTLCAMPVVWGKTMRCVRIGCPFNAHIVCIAVHFYAAAENVDRCELVPTNVCPCPVCRVELHWATLVLQLKQRLNSDKKRREERRHAILQQGSEATNRNEKRLRDLGLMEAPNDRSVDGSKRPRHRQAVNAAAVATTQSSVTGLPETDDADEWIFQL